jgi:hypothetical protein
MRQPCRRRGRSETHDLGVRVTAASHPCFLIRGLLAVELTPMGVAQLLDSKRGVTRMTVGWPRASHFHVGEVMAEPS